jgi:hypothetical protein
LNTSLPNKTFIVKILPVILIVITMAACKERINPAVIQSVTKSLEQANELISDDNQLICWVLDGKVADPQTRVGALIWEPKAREIKRLTDGVLKYIDSLKDQVKILEEGNTKEAGLSFGGRGKLYDRLTAYNKSVMMVLDTVKLGDNFDLVKQGINTRNPLLALAMLNKLQNDVLIKENSLLAYCNKNATPLVPVVTTLQPLAVLDRSYVKAGQRIEVTAGISAFTGSPETIIKINGVVIPISNDGMAAYRFTATGKPGRYKVPLVIECVVPDGMRSTIQKQLEYTIVQ